MLPRFAPAFMSEWFRNDETRLYEILSGLETKTRNRASLDEMLEALDHAKPAMFECLRKHFEFPIEAKALTQKILNLCLAKYHYRSRNTVVLSRPPGLVHLSAAAAAANDIASATSRRAPMANA